jgi:4,4'-diaponeurosporenoate glycosyltransferase
MMLVDRQHYARAGGHESVKGWILENFRLADRFREMGAIVRSVPGRGRLSFRMYPGGPGELVEGWTKAFSSGAGKTPGRVLFVTIAWMSGLMLAAIGLLATREVLTWGSLYLACALQVAWVSRRVGTFQWYAALLYPIPLVFFFVVFARSATRSGKRVRWKGRDIPGD